MRWKILKNKKEYLGDSAKNILYWNFRLKIYWKKMLNNVFEFEEEITLHTKNIYNA